MQNSARQSDSLPRGVYFGNHKLQGDDFIFAVDSRGNATKIIRLTGGISEDAAVRKLRAWLDAHDPLPRLQLVRHEPVDPNRSRTYNDTYEPVEVYWARLRRAGASRIPPRYR